MRAMLLALLPLAAKTTIAVTWATSGHCAGETSIFIDELRERRPEVHLGAGRDVLVTITEDQGTYRGTLAFDQTTRTAEASSCSELFTGLALIAAIAIPDDPEPPSPASGEADASPPTTPDPAPPRIAAVERHLTFGMALTGSYVASYRFVSIYRVGFALDVSYRKGPLLSIGFERGLDSNLGLSDQTSARWTLAHLDLCPRLFLVHDSLFAGPCLAADGGAIEAASGPDSGRTRPWFDVGAVGRVELRGGHLFAALTGGVGVNIVQDTFAVSSIGVARRTPAVSFNTSAQVGVRF